ncbi:flocculation-associated PEP-CTERM protein PepA [Duganella sp. P38]|uniref:flocculation-associated PEP-CTERM protein PepA n=1 Tax=Duganella sp. P38 TaxID=3423949 RepID=UPI003D7B1AF9
MKSITNKLSSYAAGLAVAAAVTFAPAAYADQLFNWQLDLPGAAPLNLNINNLSFNGASSIVNTVDTNTGNFTFTDTGVFNILQKNVGGALLLGGGQLTLNYRDATGSGNLNTGNFTFTDTGVLEVYYNPTVTYGTTAANRYGATDGTLLATFQQIAGGGGNVNPDGTPAANGDLSLFFRSTYFLANTWFDSNGDPLNVGATLGFVTTNASQDLSNNCPGPSCTVDPNLLTALGGVAPNAPPGNFLVVNGGQLKLDVTPVPEPGTLALMGLGLMGVVLARRRNSKA